MEYKRTSSARLNSTGPINSMGTLGARSASSGLVATKPGLINAMTVDVEDYFQVSAFDDYISRNDWDQMPSRIEANVDRILELFDRRNVSGTFFTLGWVADNYPGVVRRIVDEGHELASHGWWHRRVTSLSPDKFSEDVRKTKTLLEDISGTAVKGYRAPSYSVNESTPWVHDILAETGHKYSSSIAPVKHDHYGMPDAPRFHHRRGQSGLLEVPVSTIVFRDNNIPAGGGGWFRLYPYFLSRYCIRKINTTDQQAGVFYFHPWEFDPDQPRQKGLDATTRFRHYVNLHSMQRKVDRLLGDFSWGRMDDIFLGYRESECMDDGTMDSVTEAVVPLNRFAAGL